jgi:hypothetical protein
MTSSDNDVPMEATDESSALAKEVERSATLSRWTTIAAYGSAFCLIAFALLTGDLPSLGELWIWLPVLGIICFAPLEPVFALFSLRGTGVRIRYVVVSHVAVVREGKRLRLHWSTRWLGSEGQVMPTEQTIDRFIPITERVSMVQHFGALVKGVVLSIVAVGLIWTDVSRFIIVGFCIGALWMLAYALFNLWAVKRGARLGAQFPNLRRSWEASLRINASFIDGKRPREIDPNLVSDLLVGPRGTPHYVIGRVNAALVLLDRGQVEEAVRLMDESLAATNRGFAFTHYDVLLEAAFFAASIRHDPVTARSLLGQATGMSIDRYKPKLIEATILMRERRMAEARVAAEAGMALIPKALYTGVAAMSMDYFQEVIAAADQALAEAFTNEVLARSDAAGLNDPTPSD